MQKSTYSEEFLTAMRKSIQPWINQGKSSKEIEEKFYIALDCLIQITSELVVSVISPNTTNSTGFTEMDDKEIEMCKTVERHFKTGLLEILVKDFNEPQDEGN